MEFEVVLKWSILRLAIVDTKLEVLKQENKQFLFKLTAVEQEVGEVKDSVELAHKLIGDGKAELTNLKTQMHEEMNDRAKEMSNNKGA